MNIYHYVYQITNTINGNIYVGVRQSKVSPSCDTGYWGSGTAVKRAIKKYGIENFKKDILSTHYTRQDALAAEAEIVTIEFALREDTYNLKAGGCGGSIKGTMSTEGLEKMSKALKGKRTHNKGKPWSDDVKKKISDSKKGKKLAPRSDEVKKKISESNKGKHSHNKGKPWSDARRAAEQYKRPYSEWDTKSKK